MLNNKIKFEERVDSNVYNTTTLYFTAPKDILDGKHPEATCASISIEFPINHTEANYASVEFSPTLYDKTNEEFIDYHWYDVQLPYNEIEELILLAMK